MWFTVRKSERGNRMIDDGKFWCGLVAGMLLFSAIGVASLFIEKNKWQAQAVEHGYAEYNPKTGEWGWKK